MLPVPDPTDSDFVITKSLHLTIDFSFEDKLLLLIVAVNVASPAAFDNPLMVTVLRFVETFTIGLSSFCINASPVPASTSKA